MLDKLKREYDHRIEESLSLNEEMNILKVILTESEEKHANEVQALQEEIDKLKEKNTELNKTLNEKVSSPSKPHTKSTRIPSIPKILNSKQDKINKTMTPDRKYAKVPMLPIGKIINPDSNQNLEEKASEKFKSLQIVVEEDKTQEIITENPQLRLFQLLEDQQEKISDTVFANGVKKEIYADGTIKIIFTNNDIKETSPDGKTVYFFNETKAMQISFSDGLQLFKFPNGQVEKHFPDGTKEITFPDGIIKMIYTDGEEETIFPNGVIQKIDTDGIKLIEYPNGIKDVVLPNGKKIRNCAKGNNKGKGKGIKLNFNNKLSYNK